MAECFFSQDSVPPSPVSRSPPSLLLHARECLKGLGLRPEPVHAHPFLCACREIVAAESYAYDPSRPKPAFVTLTGELLFERR
eukprot:740151-Pelagomonas_calceolata.AAC.1